MKKRVESGTRLFCEEQRPEMLGYMVRVTVDDAGGLPAHEMAAAVGAQTVDAIQIRAPLRSWFYGLITDRFQWHARRRVPHVRLFIDTSCALPAGLPLGIVALFAQVDGQIHPIAGGRNLKLTIALDVFPVVAEEELYYIAVPEVHVVFTVVRGPEIEHGIRADEQQIKIAIGPECAHFSLEVGVVELVRAILDDPRGCGVGPCRRSGIGVQLGG